jgi:ATP-binding cassette subfamily A (ABC1) protein 3
LDSDVAAEVERVKNNS